MIFNTPTIGQGHVIETPSCPTCRAVLDGYTNIASECRPEVGDFTVCGYCSEMLRFTDGMQLRVITERDAITPETARALAVAMKLVVIYWAEKGVRHGRR